MPESQRRLLELGWTSAAAGHFARDEASHYPARVCRVDRGGLDLAGATGAVRATYGGALLHEMAGSSAATPVVGDWTAVRDWPDGRVTVETVLSRRSVIVRDSTDRTSQGQPIAANVDLVVIVEHLDPDPDLGRVERLLVLAWGSGARPMIVLTKPDLVPDVEGMRAEVAAVAPGVDVVTTNARTGDGVEALESQLAPGRTLALIGASGAGKSSLINLLAGADVTATGAVRPRDGTGRHTTTHRHLVVLPGRGVLIDTPGLRAVGVVAEPDAVDAAFADVAAYARSCRFQDCAHDTEPGCAIRAAVEAGDLDGARVARWHKLDREAADQANRADARVRALESVRRRRRTEGRAR